MGVPDTAELDRLFSLWKEALWKAHGVSAKAAMNNRELYRYRIVGIDRPDETSFEVHIEFAPNAVYGITHLPRSTAGIVIPLVSHSEVDAPSGMAHLLTEFITAGGIEPSNFVGTDGDGNPVSCGAEDDPHPTRRASDLR
ncbi:hypothetical protein [Rhodococcus pyridinivorans]|uniref:hypothetical protein n=1 Tax=Rhodococcus pyridinivorans TaxID=103816 RepID=UPI00265B2668|nr:hypothetical protein [Rhodococcus pyridinivorans]